MLCLQVERGSRPRHGAGMSILGTLIIGLLAGAVAKLLMPGCDVGGFLAIYRLLKRRPA